MQKTHAREFARILFAPTIDAFDPKGVGEIFFKGVTSDHLPARPNETGEEFACFRAHAGLIGQDHDFLVFQHVI